MAESEEGLTCGDNGLVLLAERLPFLVEFLAIPGEPEGIVLVGCIVQGRIAMDGHVGSGDPNTFGYVQVVA